MFTAILVFLMCLHQPGIEIAAHSQNYYNPYGGDYLQYLTGRLAYLEHVVYTRLHALEQKTNQLSSEQCQTGVVTLANCPAFGEVSLTDIINCVNEPTAGLDTVIMNVTVNFDSPFSRPPVIDASFSGLAMVMGKNCSVEVIDVASNQFTLQYVADDFLPLETKVSYFACPSAISMYNAAP